MMSSVLLNVSDSLQGLPLFSITLGALQSFCVIYFQLLCSNNIPVCTVESHLLSLMTVSSFEF